MSANQQSNGDDSIIKISISLDGSKSRAYNFKVSQDKKLKYLIDRFCKQIKEENDDTFFQEFDFYLSPEKGNLKLDPDITIKQNGISHKSAILAVEKPINPNCIRLKIKDLKDRKIPVEINKEHAFKKICKPFCDSVNLDISNTLFFYNDQKIEMDMTPNDINGIKDNDIISIIQKNPIFTIFVENVPYGTNENELIDFFSTDLKSSFENNDHRPLKCEIFMSDNDNISGYAKINFKSKTDAMLAIVNCSKNEFKNHRMSASLQ